MGISKYGTGEIIGPDDENLQKTAKPEWTDKDAAELAEENGDVSPE
jgi:hypothetical protein